MKALKDASGRRPMSPSVSESTALPLTLSHELRVDGRLYASGGPFYSGWFGHPDGDQDRLWRLYVTRDGGSRWALQLQLATAEERDTIFRRQPRFEGRPRGASSQSNYILTSVDARVVFQSVWNVASMERPAATCPNPRALGYLDTLEPVTVAHFEEKWPGTGTTTTTSLATLDSRNLIIQLAFCVEYHKQGAVNERVRVQED